jgi:hypothetical protein
MRDRDASQASRRGTLSCTHDATRVGIEVALVVAPITRSRQVRSVVRSRSQAAILTIIQIDATGALECLSTSS